MKIYDYYYFPLFKKAVSESDIPLEVIIKCKKKLLNLLYDFDERVEDLVALKLSTAFLLKPFEIGLINNVFTMDKCLLPETAEG